MNSLRVGVDLPRWRSKFFVIPQIFYKSLISKSLTSFCAASNWYQIQVFYSPFFSISSIFFIFILVIFLRKKFRSEKKIKKFPTQEVLNPEFLHPILPQHQPTASTHRLTTAPSSLISRLATVSPSPFPPSLPLPPTTHCNHKTPQISNSITAASPPPFFPSFPINTSASSTALSLTRSPPSSSSTPQCTFATFRSTTSSYHALFSHQQPQLDSRANNLSPSISNGIIPSSSETYIPARIE